MSSIYTGSPTLTTSITIPADGDLANALSVNVSSKALIDMQTFMIQSFGQVQQSTSPIRMYTTGAATFVLRALPIVVVNEAGVWKTINSVGNTSIGTGNIEGGGAFVANTWYYTYAYSVAGVFTIQLSTTPPDLYQLYKNDGTFRYKFLGSFRTDGAGAIIDFSKYGEQVQYSEAPTLSGGGTASSSETLIGTLQYVPLYKSTPTQIKLLVEVEKTDAAVDNLHIISVPGTTGLVFPLYEGKYSIPMDVITSPGGTLYWRTDFTTTTITVGFGMVGFNE